MILVEASAVVAAAAHRKVMTRIIVRITATHSSEDSLRFVKSNKSKFLCKICEAIDDECNMEENHPKKILRKIERKLLE